MVDVSAAWNVGPIIYRFSRLKGVRKQRFEAQETDSRRVEGWVYSKSDIDNSIKEYDHGEPALVPVWGYQ
jgi:hypothetical protein